MPHSPIPRTLTAERRYYLLVEQAGTDIELLRSAIEFGIREAGMSLSHPHIRAMLAYCAGHEVSGQVETPKATGTQHGIVDKIVGIALH